MFGGYPVAFCVTHDPGSGIRHRVEVLGLRGWLAWRLGFDPRDVWRYVLSTPALGELRYARAVTSVSGI